MRKILCRLSGLILILASSLAHSLPASERLERSVTDMPLSPRAKDHLLQMLADAGVSNSRVEDVVKLRVRTTEWVIYRGHWMELQTYLQKISLRIGLTPVEISHYREFGELPKPTSQSFIESLGLPPRVTLALYEAGANFIGDVPKLRQRNGDVFVPGIGKLGAVKIHEAMINLGLAPTPQEDDPATNRGDLRGLSMKTLKALTQKRIERVEHLLAMTEFELEQIDGLGPQGIIEIGAFFHAHDQKLYDSVLERAIAEGQALDLTLRLHPAARISKTLRHHLEFLGVETFQDLLDRQKVGRMRLKPLPVQYSREFKGLIDKFHEALKPTLETHAHLCGMQLL